MAIILHWIGCLSLDLALDRAAHSNRLGRIVPNSQTDSLAGTRQWPSRAEAHEGHVRSVGGVVVGLAVVAVAAIYSAASIDFTAPPAEDAAMLMRYAQHLAAGAGIVWNIGESPVDGATDFLFMVLVAGLARAGASLEAAVLGLGLLAHVATTGIVYVTLARDRRVHVLVAAFCALWLAIGPGRAYVAVYFGTTFFAMLAAIAWLFFLRAFQQPIPSNAAGFAIASLLLGLDRPEGVFLSVFMLGALVLWHGWRRSRVLVLAFAVAVGLIGGTYFVWRWAYFGYPFPNPFYKKGGGSLYLHGLLASLKSTFIFLLPVWPAFAIGLLSRETARRTAIVLLPILGFTGIWILLSDEMNWLGRFQYAVMPLGLMAWPEAVPSTVYERIARFAERRPGRRNIAWGAASIAAAALLVLVAQFWSGRLERHGDGRFTMATTLSAFKDRGYVLAVTEAGLLPLYSGWKALDLWGLNDQWIAHHGIVSAAYLDRYKPQVVMIHVHAESKLTNWSQMIDVMKDYVAHRNYLLAAAWGEPSADDTHCYFVRADLPDGERLIRAIQGTEYSSPKSGEPLRNYAADPGHRCK